MIGPWAHWAGYVGTLGWIRWHIGLDTLAQWAGYVDTLGLVRWHIRLGTLIHWAWYIGTLGWVRWYIGLATLAHWAGYVDTLGLVRWHTRQGTLTHWAGYVGTWGWVRWHMGLGTLAHRSEYVGTSDWVRWHIGLMPCLTPHARYRACRNHNFLCWYFKAAKDRSEYSFACFTYRQKACFFILCLPGSLTKFIFPNRPPTCFVNNQSSFTRDCMKEVSSWCNLQGWLDVNYRFVFGIATSGTCSPAMMEITRPVLRTKSA